MTKVRTKKIVELIHRGKTYRQVSDELGLSLSTVHHHANKVHICRIKKVKGTSHYECGLCKALYVRRPEDF